MKIDLTSLYFNGETQTPGNTASWGTALGQKEGNQISVEGAIEIINLMKNIKYSIKFDPKNNPSHKANIRQLKDKEYPYAAKFDFVYVNKEKVEGPFFMVVTEDTQFTVETQKHIGRKILKYNTEIEVDGFSNRKFYERVQNMFGKHACWFVSDIYVRGTDLCFSAHKVSDLPKEYKDAKERKDNWNLIVNDFTEIKDMFKNYLLKIHKIKTEKTADEYIRTLSKVKVWFVDNKICNDDFQIWDVNNDYSNIQHAITGPLKNQWKSAAKKDDSGDSGFMMATWNRWVEFSDWFFKRRKVNEKLVTNYLAIKTKPFVILAGLSGTGKSRLVRTLAYQFNNIDTDIEERKNPPTNFQLIKVKPNWHDSSELLGYESRISGKDRFVATDFIRFIVKAWQYPGTPFFLCLDEMNLAPVEQYFAEYLSAVETRRANGGKIKTDALISGKLIAKYADKENGVDTTYELWNELELTDTEIQNELKANGLGLPSNLIVMGTVNMDETTHSFSRKVLDRAMTIEMNDINLSEGLAADSDDWSYPSEPLEKEIVLSERTQGAEVFSELSSTGEEIITYLDMINRKLEGSPFKIAYRVRDEFLLYAYNYSINEAKPEDWKKVVLDEMTLMKILPRIEGDEGKTKILDDLMILFQEYNLPKSLNKATEMVNRRRLSHYTSFWS
jgi:5-methylcytosine-specific restriction protein B